MTFTVLLHPKAAKELKKTEKSVQDRIIKSARNLREKPTSAGKPLSHTGFWSMRIGDYRAIYQIEQDKKQVIILFIGHRSQVYDDFSKML